jgi:hypothetical protein
MSYRHSALKLEKTILQKLNVKPAFIIREIAVAKNARAKPFCKVKRGQYPVSSGFSCCPLL